MPPLHPPPADRPVTVGEPKYNGKSISEWVDAFCDPKTNSDALIALMRIGPQALPLVLERLRGHRRELGVETVTLLRTMRAFGLDISAQLDSLKDSDDPDIRWAIERGLEPLSEEERAVLASVLGPRITAQSEGVRIVLAAYPEYSQNVLNSPELLRKIDVAYADVCRERPGWREAANERVEEAKELNAQIAELKIVNVADLDQLTQLKVRRDMYLAEAQSHVLALGQETYWRALAGGKNGK